MLNNITVLVIKQLSDNYSYLITSQMNNHCIIVDPADANPIINMINKHNFNLKGILITHHHSDHTSGIEELLEYKKVDVFSPNSKIYGTTKLVQDKYNIDFEFISFKIIATPGHTLDHIVYYSKNTKILFCGDLLFGYGCGRVFEGTFQQMLNSLNKIKNLSDDIKIYCGHEYTYKNLEFIINELMNLKNKHTLLKSCKESIEKKGSTMPFHLSHEKKWNPFLNCGNFLYKKNIENFQKNIGKITSKASELDFFTFIRKKRNVF